MLKYVNFIIPQKDFSIVILLIPGYSPILVHQKMKSIGSSINFILILLSCVIALTPVLNRNFPKIIWIAINIAWYFVAFPQMKPSRETVTFIFSVLLWWGYEYMLSVLGISSASIGNYFLLLCYFDIVFKSFCLLKNDCGTFNTILLRSIQVIIVGNTINNIQLGGQIEGIHYLIVQNPELYGYTNAGATEFYNVFIFFVPACLYLFLKEKNVIWRCWDLICILLAFYFMLNYETRATSLVMTFLLLVFVYISQRAQKKIDLKKILFFVIFLYAVFSISANMLIEILPERVAVRLDALNNRDFNDAEGYTSRFGLIQQNIRTWLSSFEAFVMGVGYHLEGAKSHLMSNHSAITDYIARYGLIGVAFLWLYLKKIKSLFSSEFFDMKQNNFISVVFLFIIVIMIMTSPFKPENAVSAFLFTCLAVNYNRSII